MSQSLKRCHSKRGGLKSQLTLFEKTLNEINENELAENLCQNLKERLVKIELIYDSFNELQSEIEFLSADNEQSLNQELVYRETFQNFYFELIAKAKVLLANVDMQTQNLQNNHNNSDFNATNYSVKLPTLNLPTFDGTFTAWRSFYDSFKTLIDNNHNLSNAQKLAYLKSALKGEPQNLILTLETIDANYAIALNILKSRYDNKRRIVTNHVQSILNLQSVQRESPTNFRFLINSLQTHVNCLRSLGQPVEQWDALLVPIIVSKLDNSTIREWETKLNNVIDNEHIPSIDELLQFLTTKLNTLETINNKYVDLKSANNQKTHTRSSFTLAESKPTWCPICKGQHLIYQCNDFINLNDEAKNKKAREKNLCINCLRKGHFLNNCKSLSRCRLCRMKHHTLLHMNKKNIVNAENSDKQNSEAVSTNCSSVNIKSQTILSTAQVGVNSIQSKMFYARALLDSASQSNFISERFCKRLNLKQTPFKMQITGIGKGLINITKKVELTIHSVCNNYQVKINCLVVPEITNSLPTYTFDASSIEIPANIKLADQEYNIAQPIDLLLGANVFWSLLCVGQIKQDKIIFQKTKLGWVISGELFNESFTSKGISCLSLEELNEKVERFWQVDEFILPDKGLTDEETYCESYFKDTTERDGNGKFIVKIPFKNNSVELGESYDTAKNRFIALEKRFERDEYLKVEYSKFINEYIKLNHMTRINMQRKRNEYYFPHHYIIKEHSETTKLRVVFDGSCKTTNGSSFNDVQCKGPVLQDDLFSIIARFRLYQYVFSADIEKMYRQVWVHKDVRHYQRILWRENPTDPLDIYELQTLTYGTTSAPYLAIRCLIELANEVENTYPIEAQTIRNDFYVDDLLTGSNNLSDVIMLKDNITKILKGGGFPLRKFHSNVHELNDQTLTEKQILNLSEKECKTLGVCWNPSKDLFSYSFNVNMNQSEVTKRNILAITAQLYDPLGLLTPIIIIAKLIIQELWRMKLNWDESVPMQIYSAWINFKDNLKHINNICIPRHVLVENYSTVELHAFSDASERAYGTCIYLKSKNNYNQVKIALLASKSRVAPLKSVSLPRLELCGAVLAAQLANKFKSMLRINIEQEYYWCDSEIVLAWIKSNQNKWKNYVANRVGEIQRLTNPDNWYHVRSENNPADLITRGVAAKDLSNINLWWKGPQFLADNLSIITKVSIPIDIQDPPEAKSNIQIFCITNADDIFPISKFSTIKRLKRVTAYCLRFLSNLRKPKNNRQVGPLTVNEISTALKKLIQIIQKVSFPHEYERLSQNSKIKQTSKLLTLTPFMDDNKIIRVGGRLKSSQFNYDKKHPIVLPTKNHFTELLIKNEHELLMHAGPKLTLSSIRETFWPISGNNIAKKVIRNCMICFKYNSKPLNQIMGNLPKERTQIMYPFHTTGVDYAGPYTITNRKGRGNKTITKCYICLFICFSTKCVHLELVTSLSTDAFLQSFRRFIARRGKPLNVMSDNGTNFIGANNELKKLGEFLNENGNWFKDTIASLGINWNFIPPRAPNFAGLWEAGVKSVKHHLKRILTNTLLTYEEFNTLLIQVEAILNSRPLSPLSTDPNDLEPLTPAHFLIGRTFTNIPDQDLQDVPENRLNRFQFIQKLNQNFWTKWSKEYISQLQQRNKWKDGNHQIKEGSLVIIKEDNSSPAQWRLARVIKVHPGPDSVIRVVTLKCANGELKRSVNRICVLPTDT